MGLSFVGCVVVASVIVFMTAMAFLGACLSMWLMEKFLTFMAEETMPSSVCVCGCGRSASEVCGTTEYVINFGWVKKNDSYSPPEEVKDVCEIAGCTLIPQAGETICSACWNKHDSYNTPGFPEGFDDISEEGQAFADKADQYEVNKCSGDQESYDWREAE